MGHGVDVATAVGGWAVEVAEAMPVVPVLVGAPVVEVADTVALIATVTTAVLVLVLMGGTAVFVRVTVEIDVAVGCTAVGVVVPQGGKV